MKRKPFASGVRWHQGAWRYRVPRWVSDSVRLRVFSGKGEVTLGKTMPEATKEYARIQDELGHVTYTQTVADLIDRYLLEVVPTKRPQTQRSNVASLTRLRAVFGSILVIDFESPWAFQYREKNKHRPTTANRDLEVLSHLFSKAIEWGVIRNSEHPMRGLRVKNAAKARTRYVTDDELAKALELASPFLRAYIGLKLQTGLRKSDLLRLKLDDANEEGIRAFHAKTEKGTVYPWTDDRRAAWVACVMARPRYKSDLLFVTRDGKSYVAENGATTGFDSIWQRFMAKVVAAGVERFTEHDLRAKVATDAPSLESARKLLGHKSASTTKAVYDRKDERAD